MQIIPHMITSRVTTWVLLAVLLLASVSVRGQLPQQKTIDICIYGATPAGVAAAIAAAKSDKRVLLAEPSGQIGGLLTSGLSYSDYLSIEAVSGSFLEFSQRVEKHYVDTYGADSEPVARSRKGTIGEPHINRMILEEWLREYSTVEVLLHTALDSVITQDSNLRSAEFFSPNGNVRVTADIFIDGSYEGDLMAQSGVAYRVGREGKDRYHESLAPDQTDQQLQGYNFRFCATNNPDNRAPVLPPAGYQRDDYLAVIPFLNSGKIKHIFDYPSQCIFKAHPLPNRKYDINDVSNGLIRLSMPDRNWGWPEGRAEERRRIFAEHLRHSVGLLYFIQNDSLVPPALQNEARQWGWCRDEFVDNQHLPPQLYVREARRMQGRYVYTQHDSEYDSTTNEARAVFHSEAIAMSDYGNNCHGTTHAGPLIGGQHHGEFYNPVPPYQIPYGVMLPREYDNLLVPVAVSSSHVGFCALRFEPTWMSLGQAAGHAAALSHDAGRSLPELDVTALQRRLHGDRLATIYTSDVRPGHPDFEAVQWWGMQKGLHGLQPRAKGSPRGPLIEGQYFEAAPGHQVFLDTLLTESLRNQWIRLAGLSPADQDIENSQTRGQFIRAAFARAKQRTGER